jgi:hypothetical protein
MIEHLVPLSLRTLMICFTVGEWGMVGWHFECCHVVTICFF